MVAVSASAETLAENDFSKMTDYTMWHGEAGAFGIKDGGLSVTNEAATANFWDLQYMVADGLKVVADTEYTVAVKIKGFKGSLHYVMGAWGTDVFSGAVTVEEKADWQTVSFKGSAAADVEGVHVLLQSGEFVGTYVIESVKITYGEGGDTPEEPTSDWVSIITNGNANNGPSDNILARIGGKDDPAAVVANPSGEGKVFEAPIIAKTEGVNDWDSQMFIKFDQPVEEGAKIKVSFDYYCTNQRTVQTQAHGEPGNYQHWDMIGDLNAKPEWQKVSKELTVSAAQAKGDDGNGSGKGLIAIAMNLSTAAEAGTFYINNVVVEIEKGAGVEAVAVPVQVNTGVYNLQGVKVANSLEEVTVPGLYITNGKKVIKK